MPLKTVTSGNSAVVPETRPDSVRTGPRKGDAALIEPVAAAAGALPGPTTAAVAAATAAEPRKRRRLTGFRGEGNWSSSSGINAVPS